MNDYERDPFKTMVLIAMFIFGILSSVAFRQLGGNTLKNFPPPYGWVFSFGLILVTGVSLYGVMTNKTVRGVLYERAGMIGMSILFLTYGSWAIGLFGSSATGFTLLVIAVGIAALVRVVQIQRRKGRIRGNT